MTAPYALVICGDAGNIIVEHNAEANVINWLRCRIQHWDMDGVFKKVTTSKHREFSSAVAWEWAAEQEAALRADPAHSEDELTSLCELLSELNSADEQDTTVMIGEFCDEFGHEWPDLSYYNQSAFFLYECLAWFCRQMSAVVTTSVEQPVVKPQPVDAPPLDVEFEVTQYHTRVHKLTVFAPTAAEAVIKSLDYTDSNPEFIELNTDIGTSIDEFPDLATELEKMEYECESYIPAIANVVRVTRDADGPHYFDVETGDEITDEGQRG